MLIVIPKEEKKGMSFNYWLLSNLMKNFKFTNFTYGILHACSINRKQILRFNPGKVYKM